MVGREVHLHLLSALMLFHVTRGEDLTFDVTTVYNLGANRPDAETLPSFLDVAGRVHARADSVKFPLNGNLTERRQPLDNITCDFSDWTCSWRGWRTEYLDQSIMPGKAYRVMNSLNSLKIVFNSNNDSYQITERYNAYRRSYSYYNEHYVTKYYNPAYMYFTSDSTVLGNNNAPFYVIKINPSSHVYPYMYSDCSTTGAQYLLKFTVKNRNNQDISIYCQERTIIPPTGLKISVYPAFLSFSFEDNNVKITEMESSSLLDWHDEKRTQNINYFSMCGEFLDHMGASIKVPVYSSAGVDSELVSPAFTVDPTDTSNRGICLLLSMHSASAAPGDLLRVTATSTADDRRFERLVGDLRAGWNTKVVQIDMANNTVGTFKLTIKTMTSTPVKINHIGSCRTGVQEVYTIPASRVANGDLDRLKGGPAEQPLLPVYTTDVPFTSLDPVEYSTLKTARNESSCLAGFTGPKCQNGCGRNRFGVDCGGVCSLRLTECRGLLLCTGAGGCHCAPGYRGRVCTQQCDAGWYGNDCLQRCGHCAQGDMCDIYTGECAGCEPGYRPPYCNREYVYYGNKPTLTAIEYGKIQVSFNPTNAVQGTAELYQIQYREKGEGWKIHSTKSVNGGNQTDGEIKQETIDGLEAGVMYEVRVLLLDSDFNKYDSSLVQASDVRSTCKIPDEVDYDINVYRNTSSITFSWSYRNTTEHWCPLSSYEVSWKEDWQRFTRNVTESSISLAGLLPGSEVEFQVRAVTSVGFGPRSDTVHAATKRNGISRVRDLRVVETKSDSVKLAWNAPRNSENQDIDYSVEYECVEQPACALGCVGAAALEFMALASRGASATATLNSLLPFARYRITVSPVGGPRSTLFVGTNKTVPLEIPLLSNNKKIERTNTSLTVFWDPVLVCSGFKLGYNYQLAKESDVTSELAEGFTSGTSASFHNLSASTDYVVRVHIVTVAGWNPNAHLDIRATTLATVPDAVRNLTVYKSGRSIVGVRWAAPAAAYGPLKSFTISIDAGEGRMVEPISCPAWPQLYCHTVHGLRANRQHIITVSARNTEVAEDGVPASVLAVTKEASPTAPIELRLSNTSETSVGLRWEHPDLVNGQLRSFVVSVEETERFDQSACCQVYPLIETSVNSEDRTYEAEVSGLQPAATYYVSVSAKTVGLGPAQSLVVHTRPPHAPLTVLPLLLDGKLSWQTPYNTTNNSSEMYMPLVKARLLLAVVNETSDNGSGIFDCQLDTLLGENIGKPFVFVAEYTEGDAATDLMYNEPADSEWGRRPADLVISSSEELTTSGLQQLVAAQISEYNGVYNADLMMTMSATG